MRSGRARVAQRAAPPGPDNGPVAASLSSVTEMSASQRFARRAADEPDFATQVASVMATIGACAAVAGILIGVARSFHRTAVACQDGQVIPDGGDPSCYSYPDIGSGMAIAMISTALLAITALACIAVFVVVAARHQKW